ncbi:hypothetical protein FRC06_008618, partial [Ceratobasidium sp. 370]
MAQHWEAAKFSPEAVQVNLAATSYRTGLLWGKAPGLYNHITSNYQILYILRHKMIPKPMKDDQGHWYWPQPTQEEVEAMDFDEVVNYGDGKLPGDGEELMEDITGISPQVDNNPAISETGSNIPTSPPLSGDNLDNLVIEGVTTGTAEIDVTHIEPTLLALDAHAQWRNLANQRVHNTQPADARMMEIQAQRLGYAIVYAAGPLCVFDLFDISPHIHRPVDQSTVADIFTMLANGDKYDWQNPMIVQVDPSMLSPTMLAELQQANPCSLSSPLPIALCSSSHSKTVLDHFTSLWTEIHSQSGRYLTAEELTGAQQFVSEWRARKPRLVTIQGTHRFAAAAEMRQLAQALQLEMIQYGRAGKMQEYEQLRQQLTSLVESTSFLVEVYSNSLDSQAADFLALNRPSLPSNGPSF